MRTTGRDAIEELYRRDGQRLWWAVLAYCGDREVAGDAVAEAFAQALRGEDQILDPAGWVWRVAFRVAAGELKRRRRLHEVVDAVQEPDPRAGEVIAALERLTERQRAAVVLHYYAGYPQREVAAILGSSAATVGVHLHRARRRLRELLKEDGDG